MANKRLIDANALLDLLRPLEGVSAIIKKVLAIIRNCPTVDAKEVVHGRWEKYQRFVICSNCTAGWPYYKNDTDRFRYCPNCGANMDGGNEDV